jgi:DNA-binding response OmpR family regulator
MDNASALPRSHRVLLVDLTGHAGAADALRSEGLDVFEHAAGDETGGPPPEFGAAVVRAAEPTAAVLALAGRLKALQARAPLILWAPLDPARLAEALAAGYDLWLPAEVTAATVAAQMRGLVRLTGGTLAGPSSPDTISARGVTIDFIRREVTTRGTIVPITPTEFRLLACLARQPGRVFTHAELFREVHGPETGERDPKDLLKVHVSRLRNKLAAAGVDPDLVHTVRGFGYRFERRARPRRERR